MEKPNECEICGEETNKLIKTTVWFDGEELEDMWLCEECHDIHSI